MTDTCNCAFCDPVDLDAFLRKCDECGKRPVEWLYVATRDAIFLCAACAARRIR